jgi:hypothetical protein
MPKPLGHKAYGSIPHLPNSRLGPGDHQCHEGIYRICCEKTRDRYDTVIVTEKIDGSNCSCAKLNGQIVPLTRSGYTAWSSPYEQHILFGNWVMEQWKRFDALLYEGERVVGEWLAQAHGTRYELKHEPFVPFDLMTGHTRVPSVEFWARTTEYDFTFPKVIHIGGPISVEAAMEKLGPYGFHGALDPVEGAVWRVERNDPAPNGKGLHVDTLAKWVRPDKEDGKYLPKISGREPIWNWRPQ